MSFCQLYILLLINLSSTFKLHPLKFLNPQITSTIVLLPAPLGPIIPTFEFLSI